MGKRQMMMLGVLCAAVFAGGQLLAEPVPDTGVTKCYDSEDEIPCPTPGQPFYGQDGNYTINRPSYTKLDSNGNDLPNSAPSWAMVRDNVTGLIWEVKKDKDGVENYDNPHDADNTYTWYDPDDPWDPGTPSEHDTEDFLDALNAAHFGGHTDWRLPTIKELAYLVDYSIPYPGPMINTTYFPNTVLSFYWSSTTYASGTGDAWEVRFSNGHDYWGDKSNNDYVRAVRGGQSRSLDHLIINGDGTVTDTSTGLMWQQATGGEMTWEVALSYCEALSLGGHADWRLPTIKELASIVDLSRDNPAIDTTYFPNTVSSDYWSSTTYATHTDGAWSVSFNYGGDPWYYKSNNYYVRAVRGGQNRVLGHLFILAPGQGSRWEAGGSMPIIWDTQDIAGNVEITLSREGGNAGTFEIIASATANDGDYEWTVSGPGSVNCMLRIVPLGEPLKGTFQGLFSITAAAGADRYVKGDGVCAGHEPCYSTIQDAIDAAADGDAIWVCQGHYSDNIVLNATKRLRLLCGWDASFETRGVLSTATSLSIENGTLMVEGLLLRGE